MLMKSEVQECAVCLCNYGFETRQWRMDMSLGADVCHRKALQQHWWCPVLSYRFVVSLWGCVKQSDHDIVCGVVF